MRTLLENITRSCRTARTFALGALIGIGVSAHAQTGGARVFGVIGGSPRDSAMMTSAMTGAMRGGRPATLVLKHQAELGLSSKQIAQLQTLDSAQKNVAATRLLSRRSAREAVMARYMQPYSATNGGWSGPVDEAAIRAQARDLAALQADATIEQLRERHAVGAILSPAQIAKMPELEAKDMREAIQSAMGRFK
jgi:Spy/CpxP family protein refolding chaperone